MAALLENTSVIITFNVIMYALSHVFLKKETTLFYLKPSTVIEQLRY